MKSEIFTIQLLIWSKKLRKTQQQRQKQQAGQFGLQDAYMAAQLLRMTGLLGNNQPPIRMVNQLPQEDFCLTKKICTE